MGNEGIGWLSEIGHVRLFRSTGETDRKKKRAKKGIRGDRGMLCFSAPEGPSGWKEGRTCVVQGDHLTY